MRLLTLHERISIQGRFEKKGLTGMRKHLKTTKDYLWYWNRCYGITIAKWHLVPVRVVG